MAQIVLSQVGAVVGQSLLPQGVSILGQNIAGAAIGRTLGSLAGTAIDASLAAPIEGPRIDSLHITQSQEGTGLPAIYGRVRVGGHVIWASRFLENRRQQSAGKGGPRYTEYSYSVSVAIAICEGPITRLDRIWANGEVVNLADYSWRLYKGTEDQLPDPVLEAIEGSGSAPAYLGTAYIVFEDLPLDAFGNRLPQFSFEVVRAGQAGEGEFRNLVRGVNIIPASGEFVYATDIVRTRRFPGIETPINMNNVEGRSDFSVSLDQLVSDLPNVNSVALTVAWFGDDLRAGSCKIRPGVETKDRETVPFSWNVSGVTRDIAYQTSTTNGSANYGGTPSDESVLQGIAALKDAGLDVTLSPFLLMDIPQDNGLPDPYGGAEQAAFPWRGRITTTSDGTVAARADVDAFLGADGEFGYRHFILHHARLAAQAGGVETFLLGSEMVEATRIRDHEGAFPFSEALVSLASEVRAIIGPTTKISYAADWTEYGAYAPDDGSGDVLFPLDQLWGDENIDFVGIDWYAPAGDWRDGSEHLDAMAGYIASDDPGYLLANFEGGEAYDWYYEDQVARDAQIRTPINDTAYGEHWVFRQKDLKSWAQNFHFKRDQGVRSALPTQWTPGSKPLRLIEIGFPALDKGGNSPNLFYDPKSSESAFPPYSSGERDDLYQRRALSAALAFWDAEPLVEEALVWAWDGRPWPYFPALENVWSDGPNWQFGHWLNGRSGLIEVSEVLDDIAFRSGISIDTKAVEGFVEGYKLAGVSDVRSAMAPLMTAFDLKCVETGGILTFQGAFQQILASINEDDLLERSQIQTFSGLDHSVAGVQVSFVSADGAYEPAFVTVSDDAQPLGEPLRVSLPLVLATPRARSVARQILESAMHARSISYQAGPNLLGMEPGDLIQVGDQSLIMTDAVYDDGLTRSFESRPLSAVLDQARFSSIPEVSATDLTFVAIPEFLLIETSSPLGGDGGTFFCAASASPWPGASALRVGPDAVSLVQRTVMDSASGIGVLESALTAGALGRWERTTGFDVRISDEQIQSRSDLAILNGAGRLLIGGEGGWELISFAYAQLIAEDTWRLNGVLRGLNGSAILNHPAGSVLVIADERLEPVNLSESEYKLELVATVGNSAQQPFVYEDKQSLPWRVGHLRAERSQDGWAVSWTRRAVDIVDDWSLPEASNLGAYRVEAFDSSGASQDVLTNQGSIEVDASTVEVRVVQETADGRAGEWVSILLNAA